MSDKHPSKVEGTGRIQSLPSAAANDPASPKSAALSASAAIAPVLLTDQQAAAAWGIGLTLFHQLRTSAPEWFPRPIQLGPKTIRYARSEVEAAALQMPRHVKGQEPESMRRGRIERMKRGAESLATV